MMNFIFNALGYNQNKINKEMFEACLKVINQDSLPSTIEYYLLKGADVNSRDNYRETKTGKTLLMLVVQGGDPKSIHSTIDLLLKKGAHVDLQDNQGNTALILAVLSKHSIFVVKQIVKLLIQNKADSNIQSKGGMTALHWSTWMRDGESIANILIENGANQKLVGDDKTTLEWAKLHENFAIVQLLQEDVRRNALIGELRKQARILNQGWKQNSSILSILPIEILINILLFSPSDNKLLTSDSICKMACKFFDRPPIDPNVIKEEEKAIVEFKRKVDHTR